MSRPQKRKPKQPRRPELSISYILAAADEHHGRTGCWPSICCGPVGHTPDTWASIDAALRYGYRGCRGGDALPKILHRHRGRPLPRPRPRPRLTVRKVLAWADAFHRRTGQWPTQKTGRVAESPPDTWQGVDYALRLGLRGLPGGDSLPRVLIRYRHVLRANYRPRLTIEQILAWADRHHARTGRWPSFESGPVRGVRGERWPTIHQALVNGGRGLPCGYTLATLLQRYRGHLYGRARPRFTETTLLAWADAHFRRHGFQPSVNSGPIPESAGDTWRRVDGALNKGQRGLPGGDTLFRFLIRNGRLPNKVPGKRHPPRHTQLSIPQILAWADEFHRRRGRWPRLDSGPIDGVRDESWQSVDWALRDGSRGLPGGSSVALLLNDCRGAPHRHRRRKFTKKDIVAWADAYHRRAGRWPTAGSGDIPESPGDTWLRVSRALQLGLRGLSGRDSLLRVLYRYGRVSARDQRIQRQRTMKQI